MAERLCFFKNGYCSQSDIHISPLDHGFLYGMGTYGVIPFVQRTPLWLDHYLNHWHASLIELNCQKQIDWPGIIAHLIDNYEADSGYIYLHASLGAAPLRGQDPIDPTLLAIPQPYSPPSQEELQAPWSALCVDDIERCQTRQHKHTSKWAYRQAFASAKSQGYDEAIFHKSGSLLEGASSNILLLSGRQIISPPKDGIYAGVTRAVIQELAPSYGYEFIERPIHLADISSDQEIVLTGSLKTLRPVGRINDIHVTSGPLWFELMRAYQSHIECYVHQHQTSPVC